MLLSFLHHDGALDAHDFALRLRSWTSQGLRVLDRPPVGLGRTVKTVVDHARYAASPRVAARQCWVASGRTGAANGSLMRTHALGACLLARPCSRDELYAAAMDYSLVTHYDPRCVVACCVVTALVRGMLCGEVRNEAALDAVVEDAFRWVLARAQDGHYHPEGGGGGDGDGDGHGDGDGDGRVWGELAPVLDRDEFVRHAYAASLASLQLDDARSMGYVYKALGAALLCLRRAMRAAPNGAGSLSGGSEDGGDGGSGGGGGEGGGSGTEAFRTLVAELVMCGGDADTNACVACALVGCWVGYAALPPEWRDGIRHRDWLLAKTDALAQVAGLTGNGAYSGSEDPDTAFDGGRGLLDQDALRARGDAFLNAILVRMKAREDAAAATAAGVEPSQGKSKARRMAAKLGKWMEGRRS